MNHLFDRCAAQGRADIAEIAAMVLGRRVRRRPVRAAARREVIACRFGLGPGTVAIFVQVQTMRTRLET
jgi:hypothetical protein